MRFTSLNTTDRSIATGVDDVSSQGAGTGLPKQVSPAADPVTNQGDPGRGVFLEAVA